MMFTLHISAVAAALCALYTLWILQRYIFRYSFVLHDEIRAILLELCEKEYSRCVYTVAPELSPEACSRLARRAAAMEICISQLRR